MTRRQSGFATTLLGMKRTIYPSEGGAGSSDGSARNSTARHPQEGNKDEGKLEDNGLDARRGRRGHCEPAGDQGGRPELKASKDEARLTETLLYTTAACRGGAAFQLPFGASSKCMGSDAAPPSPSHGVGLGTSRPTERLERPRAPCEWPAVLGSEWIEDLRASHGTRPAPAVLHLRG